MHRTFKRACGLALTGALIAAPAPAAAQAPDVPSLRQAFEAAWQRQPEWAGLAARRDAVTAQQQAAQAWTPEPLAVALAAKRDRASPGGGARELALGVALPLWLPGERGLSQALAQAEGQALDSHTAAARLRLAGVVREAWWHWQRGQADAATARAQLANAQRIAADVAQRVQAGDLARADQHQADGAVAAAQMALAQAGLAAQLARQQLHTLTAGATPNAPEAQAGGQATDQATHHLAHPAGAQKASHEVDPLGTGIGAEPEPLTDLPELDQHVELAALQDRATLAQREAALAERQTRGHPELAITATQGRGGAGEAWTQSLTVGVRIPLAAGPRQHARLALAQAGVAELQAQLNLERARLAGDRQSAQSRTQAVRVQLAAAERRAQLAVETRGFFDKSFRLGQTDLPTRLRIEAEAAEAERQAVRTRIELASAISTWRQALGLLPP